jgi:hypothetical protein
LFVLLLILLLRLRCFFVFVLRLLPSFVVCVDFFDSIPHVLLFVWFRLFYVVVVALLVTLFRWL